MRLPVANWCSNYVSFSSKDEKKLQQVVECFQRLRKQQLSSEEGQVPDFVINPEKWLFEINVDDNTLQFETKWSPCIEVIKQTADHFEVDFEYDYDEPGNGVYGKAIYTDKVLKVYNLESKELDSYTRDDNSGLYAFEGQEWECEEEIKEELLKRKILQNGDTA